MLRLIAALRPNVLAIALALLLGCGSSNLASAAGDEICNVNADQALGIENYPVAIALHQQVLQAHNDNALAHYHLGFAYGMTGRTSDEISEYLSAARLGLHEWYLFLNLGLAYLSQNDLPKAIQSLQTAVLLGPDHSQSHFNLAISYERNNRLGEALEEITTSVNLAPKDPDAHNTKAIICVETGNLACARDEWSYLLLIAPDYTPARVNLAILSGSYMTRAASDSTPPARENGEFRYSVADFSTLAMKRR
jgi:Flp pilus assembly protein TadD